MVKILILVLFQHIETYFLILWIMELFSFYDFLTPAPLAVELLSNKVPFNEWTSVMGQKLKNLTKNALTSEHMLVALVRPTFVKRLQYKRSSQVATTNVYTNIFFL